MQRFDVLIGINNPGKKNIIANKKANTLPVLSMLINSPT
jgi:hypothetical protein